MADEPYEVEEDETTKRRREEGRCVRCGNWPAICGHDLSFKDRMKGVNATFLGWSETR